MLASRTLFSCLLSLFLCFNTIVAVASENWNWNEIANDLQGLLDKLELSSHENQNHHVSSGLLRRRGDSTARSTYWQPLSPTQRPAPSDSFSDQLSQLAGQLGSSLNQLIALIQQQYNIGPPIFASSSSSSSSPPESHPTVLPITRQSPGASYYATTPRPSTNAAVSVTVVTAPASPTIQSLSSSSSVESQPQLSSGTGPGTGTGTIYTFDPQASNLNVVYYSQTDLTSTVSLTQICSDPSIDIIILAFVTELFGPGNYPSMNMASNCWAPNAAQQAAGATGLLDCVGDGLAAQIATCQSQQGKKVMLSLGGAFANLQIPSEDQAVEAAHTLWDLFLGGVSNSSTTPLRPYGNVILDGIDLDNENPANAAHLPTLMSTLRSLMASTDTDTDTTGPSTSTPKAYYLSAAPQCPQPDASIPVPELLGVIDFFNVQFYNNPSCQLNAGQPFLDSLRSWSQALMQDTTTTSSSSSTTATDKKQKRRSRSRSSRINNANANTNTHDGTINSRSNPNPNPNPGFITINNGITAPRLLLGTPAFPAAGTGYVNVSSYMSILEQVKDLALPNLAGAVFWDGAYEIRSGAVIDESGTEKTYTYADVVREAFG
ncbi:hypothetical protein LTS06_009427 [Exophiala xenobiotica]|nr:hypothetical protein LTS06_009427 [Exophiala xenobiotica]